MKKLLVMMALALVPMLSFGQSVYSRSGSYEGKVDSNGKIYDRSGSYKGEVRSNGYIYDRSGSYRGKISSGSYYDRSGSYCGKAQGVPRATAAALLFFDLLMP